MICTPPTAGTCAPEYGRLTRDIAAAWVSWQRARQVADALPADDSDRAAMRDRAARLAVRQRLPGPCGHLRQPV